MKEFMQVLRRFVFPYKKYVVLSIVFNVLSALLNIFSFAALIPILQILFKTGDNVNVTTPVDSLLNRIEVSDIAGMVFILCVVAIMFVLAPVFIIIAIFYFINKGRKDKLKLAQMALQNGQPIPEQLMPEARAKKPSLMYEYNLRSGIKQAFLGVGLMILLGIILGKFGIGIGALVFFIGVGKVVIALLDKHSAQKNV